MSSTAVINVRAHALLDLVYVALGFVSPWLLGFSGHVGATAYTLALAGFGLVMNLATDYPGGLWRRLPFAWHRWVELATPPAFIGVPWFFFADAGAMPVFLSALGVAILLTAALTRQQRIAA